jgi:opacity protein-like surface antigen
VGTYKTKGKVKFFGNVGVNLGYLFNQTISTKKNIQPKLDTDFDEFELSLLLGGGLEVKCTNRLDLSLAIRNNRGLTGLESGNGALTFKTNTIGLLVNLSYNL